MADTVPLELLEAVRTTATTKTLTTLTVSVGRPNIGLELPSTVRGLNSKGTGNKSNVRYIPPYASPHSINTRLGSSIGRACDSYHLPSQGVFKIISRSRVRAPPRAQYPSLSQGKAQILLFPSMDCCRGGVETKSGWRLKILNGCTVCAAHGLLHFLSKNRYPTMWPNKV